MQIAINASSRPGSMLLFARKRDYMMRSEKRSGYNYGGGSDRKPPKRKRRRAGFFYKVLTILLSVILWPAGMVLLWRRKLRWNATTKVLTTIVTLFAFITLIGFGLTVPTGNERFTRVQDTVNDFLDRSATAIGKFYGAICDRMDQAWGDLSDAADAVNAQTLAALADRIHLTDALEYVSDLAGKAHDFVLGTPDDETVEPSVSPAATDEATDAPTDAPSDTPDTPTPSPAASVEAPVVDGELPVYLPSVTPDPESAAALGDGLLSRDRTFVENTDAPTDAPTNAPAVEPTAEPSDEPVSSDAPTAEATDEPTIAPTDTPEPTATPAAVPTWTLKDAGEATVYYHDSGSYYHTRATCKGMSNAPEHTLREAVDAGKNPCRRCEAPKSELLDGEDIVWIDEGGVAHVTDECASFEGKWTLTTAEQATEDELQACADCHADDYLASLGMNAEATSPSATATPAPDAVTPVHALKPAGEAMVYHSSTGGWYHTKPRCSGMSGAELYPLSECVGDFKRCRACSAPLPELVNEHCLWQDENGLCHTSDECADFEGRWTLIPRDDALADGLTGCAVCGADEYLVPGTEVVYPEN